ncbi:MAG: ABC-F family ATP-binding cassette domain-containing protein [Cytophagaceae bacterium]|jgi:ATP-binding cassette subfamily F protein 3|nr:ABC-F family ATP-binding cassette domain-containing protein [Cytophagaceae bacterium]
MLTLNNVSFFFGSRVLYDEVSLQIKPKDKMGLIGANGTGKSTLLRLIVGEYTPDEGEIGKSNDCSIGFLNQDLLSYQSDEPILHVAMKAYKEAMEVQAQIDEVLHTMETSYTDALVDKLSRLQERFDALEGYSLQSNAEKILEGLGFSTADLQKPLRTFSGGWRMRVMLAQMLLSKPALLLLDEPTNHLDMPSIQWLENYLKEYEGAVVIVSHDREFLDNCVKTIVEVSHSKLNVYQGNFSFYLKEKELRQQIQQNAYENQQAQIRQTERFIERFKAKASKARQVQSKVKSLERIDLIPEVIDESAKVHFKFKFSVQPGRTIVEMKNFSKSFGDLHLFRDSHVRLERGDKVAFIGANGKGKSTLLRIMAGVEAFEGDRQEGHQVRMAFFAQHQLESLKLDNTILEELKETGTDRLENELRSILGCFLFSEDDVFKKIKVLSGGERSRVAMAKMLVSEANFLLLDEPTNHLDMQSVNILIQSLQQYSGTFICVSHDRHFVSQIANKIWFIEDMQLKEYPGTYSEFLTWQAGREKKPTTPAPAKKDTQTSHTKTKSEDVTKKIKSLEKEIKEAETTITELEKKLREIEEQLSNPETYHSKGAALQAEYTQQQQRLQQEEKKWESLLLDWEQLHG